jgi:hypothetical protein
VSLIDLHLTLSRNKSRQVFGETLLTERAVYSCPPLERPLWPPPLERALLSGCRIKNALKCPPLERPPLLSGQFSFAKGVASQEGDHCIRVERAL